MILMLAEKAQHHQLHCGSFFQSEAFLCPVLPQTVRAHNVFFVCPVDASNPSKILPSLRGNFKSAREFELAFGVGFGEAVMQGGLVTSTQRGGGIAALF